MIGTGRLDGTTGRKTEPRLNFWKRFGTNYLKMIEKQRKK